VEDQTGFIEAVHALATGNPREWISVDVLEARLGWGPGDIRTGPAIHALGSAGYLALSAHTREVAITDRGRSLIRESGVAVRQVPMGSDEPP
jgi:hypothetical protein